MGVAFDTLNQIIKAFADITERHRQLNTFFVGDNWEIGASEALLHSVLAVNPTKADMPKTENGYSSFSVDFNVKCFDLVDKDESNEQEVLSDTLEILKDIINEFNTHPFYIEGDFLIDGNVSFTPFTEAFDSEVSGWEATFTLTSPNRRSYCSNPIDSIVGYNEVPTFATVIDGLNSVELLEGQTYTCEALVPLSGIQYKRPTPTYVDHSFNLFDDAYFNSINAYNYPRPTNPIYSQELDLVADPNGYTLLHDNAFGNRIRFTDDTGVASTNGDDIYLIDNLTGLGHYINVGDTSFRGNYFAMIGTGGVFDTKNQLGIHGYTDYFPANMQMLDGLVSYNQILDSGLACMLPTFIVNPRHIFSSTPRGGSAANALSSVYYLRSNVGTEVGSINTNYTLLLTRIHF